MSREPDLQIDHLSSVFTVIDLKYPDMLQSFGLIRSNLLLQFIYKRPAYYGMQHMISFFDDAVKIGKEITVGFSGERYGVSRRFCG